MRTMRKLALFLFAGVLSFVVAMAASTGLFAATVGENLIRDDFAGDGIGGILDWSVSRSLGGVRTTRLKEAGPDGKPVLRFEGGIDGFTFDNTSSVLVPGESYLLSVKVRTHGLGKGRSGCLLYTSGWRNEIFLDLPKETDGKWVELKWEGRMIESAKNVYTCAFYFSEGLGEGCFCDVSSPCVIPLSERAATGAGPKPDTKPFTPRITPVEPLLSEIDCNCAWLDFFYPGDVDGAADGYEMVAETCGRTVAATLGENAHAKIVFGGLPEGAHALEVLLREKASGRILAKNGYEIVVRRPFAATRGRKLNNFVTELRREPLKDGAISFVLDRDGWVFVSFDAPYVGVTADVDGDANAVRPRPGEPSQAMRYLKAGPHTVTVKGAAGVKDGWVSVRSVKVMMLWFGRVSPKTDIGRYGVYGLDFFKAFGAYGWVNTPSLPEWFLAKRRADYDDLLDRGCQVLGRLTITGHSPIRNDLGRFRGKFLDHPVWKRGDAIIVDENSVGAPSLMKYNSAEVLWEMGRGGHRIDTCFEDLVRCTFSTPAREIPELSALVNAGYGTSHLVPEVYLPTMDEESDVRVVKDYWKDVVRRARALVPAAPGCFVYLIGGWLWQGVFNSWYAPDVDIREYYDDFVHMLATDPEFAEIGGIGFSTPACDEGVFRFMLHAIRHYCVDGSTERLAKRYGLRYKPGILANGDFTEGFEGWKVSSAAEGTISLGHSNKFGKSAGGQNRQYNAFKSPKKPFGDDFAVFTKSGTGANRLGRVLAGLTPGRLYEVTFCTYDVNEIERKGPAVTDAKAVSAVIDGADVIPELGYACASEAGKGLKGRPCSVTHRVVFRAKAETARLVFTDADSAGAVGSRRALNYVGARPYFVRDDRDLEMLIRFGKDRKNQEKEATK